MDTGVFSFSTPNLGDEMQSYAVLGHLDRVTQFLDRDQLGYYRGPETHVVMNSFFFLGNGLGSRWPRFDWLARPPRQNIRPVWHGFHASRPELCRGAWKEYLRSHQPIGCRDTYSVQRLTDSGIEAYFSACLTLFLSRVFPRPTTERCGVYLIDLLPEAESLVPREIRERATRLSTFPPASPQNDAVGRWGAVAELIEKLASAQLIVTRRLHAALPCVGFGTPLVVMPDPALPGIRDRMSGYDDMMSIIYTDEPATHRKRIDWLNPPVGSISPEVVERYEQFCRQLDEMGIRGPMLDTTSPLDRIAVDRIRIRNTLSRERLGAIPGISRLGFTRLRLGSRTFPVQVKFWSDQYLDLGLTTFPGLSRIDFHVEATADDRASAWTDCGRLQDLIIGSEVRSVGASRPSGASQQAPE